MTQPATPIPEHHLARELPTFERLSCRDRCELITTLASPILFIIALSLSINYAVNPVAPLIWLAPNFALSLPILICSSIGLVSAVLFTIQMIRRNAIKEVFERWVPNMAHSLGCLQMQFRRALHPGGRNEQTVTQYREAMKEWIEGARAEVGELVTIQTRDGVSLKGYWHASESKNAATAIVFHGNQMNAEHMIPWGEFYKTRGLNVLLVEYRGYGLSEGAAGGVNQEMEAYLDAEAALKFVLSQGVVKNKILAHGYSLGGLYAAALGYFYNIMHIVLDHTFTNAAAVASHTTSVAFPMAARIIDVSYAKGSLPSDPTIPGSKPLVTDRFNSLEKVRAMAGEIFVIRGREDRLMPMTFGDAFIQTKYPHDEEARFNRLVTLNGGHCDLQFFEDQNAAEQLSLFLEQRRLL